MATQAQRDRFNELLKEWEHERTEESLRAAFEYGMDAGVVSDRELVLFMARAIAQADADYARAPISERRLQVLEGMARAAEREEAGELSEAEMDDTMVRLHAEFFGLH